MSDSFPYFDLSGWIKDIRDTDCPIIPANDTEKVGTFAPRYLEPIKAEPVYLTAQSDLFIIMGYITPMIEYFRNQPTTIKGRDLLQQADWAVKCLMPSPPTDTGRE